MPLVMQRNKKLIKPALLLVCGLIGTGKSTIAAALSKVSGFELIRSDEVRKKLLGIAKDDHHYESFGEGIYSDLITDKTYSALFKEAALYLKKGRGTILDASFKKENYRREARKIAERFGVKFLILECTCPDELVKTRLKKREHEAVDISDGRWEIFESQKSYFDSINDIRAGEHMIIDTQISIDDIVRDILELINEQI